MIALGRAHDLLLQVSWANASLMDTVRAATKPYESQGAGRFSIDGPDIGITSGAVIALALTFNELCTNTTKFGALSMPAGCETCHSGESCDGNRGSAEDPHLRGRGRLTFVGGEPLRVGNLLGRDAQDPTPIFPLQPRADGNACSGGVVDFDETAAVWVGRPIKDDIDVGVVGSVFHEPTVCRRVRSTMLSTGAGSSLR